MLALNKQMLYKQPLSVRPHRILYSLQVVKLLVAVQIWHLPGLICEHRACILNMFARFESSLASCYEADVRSDRHITVCSRLLKLLK